MADGKVIIETGLDMTGATKDLNNLGKTIEKEGKEIPPIKPEVKPEVDEKAKTKTKADINSLVEEVNRILKNAKTDVNINVSDDDLNIVSSRIDTILSNTQLVTSEKVKKINAEFKKIGISGIGDNVEQNVTSKIEQGMDKATKATNKATQATHKATQANKDLDKQSKTLNNSLKKTGTIGANAMQKISKSTNGSISSVSGLKCALGKIIGVLGTIVSIRALIDLGKQSVNLASDLTEVQNVVDTAFGSMSQKMEDFADTAIETYGISKLTAKNIGSTYTAMARGMGQSLDEATDKALEMTGRVADIASFYNLTIDRANTIGRAVYSGETEPLKQIGVIMTEDQLAAFALANGYDTLYKNMNAAQKLEVRQAYFLSQTNLAAGDFVKTQDSWANQTKILSERWKEFLSVLGTGLIQVLTPVIKFLNQFLSMITSALIAFNKFLGINTEVSSTGAAGIADIADSMDDVTDSTKEATKAQKDLLGSYDKLNVIQKDTSSDTSGTGATGGAGTSGLDITETVDNSKLQAFNNYSEKIKSILQNLSSYINTNFGQSITNFVDNLKNNASNSFNIVKKVIEDIKSLLPAFTTYLQTDFADLINAVITNIDVKVNGIWDTLNMIFSDLWDIVIFPFLTKMVEEGLPMITQFYTEWLDTSSLIFSEIKDDFDMLWTEGVVPALELFRDVFSDIIDDVSAKWNEYGVPIFDGIRETIKEVSDLFKNIWETILKPIWDKIMDTLDEIWEDHLRILLQNIIDFVAKVILLVEKIINKVIIPIVDWVVDVLGPSIVDVINNIIDKVKIVVNTIIDVVAKIVAILTDIIDFIDAVFSGDWERAWSNIKDIFANIIGIIGDIAKGLVNTVVGFINTLLNGVESAINLIVRALNSISIDIPDFVPGIGGEHIGFDIPKVDISRIPYLASGAVIPPNKEFMAVLGDQSSGTNIETPLKTMIEAFNKALDARGGNSKEPIILQLPNGKVIAELVWSEEEKRYKQTGSYKPRYS